MKKNLFFAIMASVLMLTGCKTSFPVPQQSGKEDMAYLVFVGPKSTYGTVQVDVDGTKFDAKVVKPKTANRKGVQYGVAPGTRNITVKFNNNVVYNKKLFLSSQETKIINLP